ncbi:hypothetical protein ACTWP5_02960 [Streptomyces sp. 4N509B]|uniref:hypothetical protein n=1 Tax=Streptomyces sp. 4N509B TaxID=3457413 RepID=UPI003FD0945A
MRADLPLRFPAQDGDEEPPQDGTEQDGNQQDGNQQDGTGDDTCDLIQGPANDFCEDGEGGGGGGGGDGDAYSSPLDPLSSLADGCARAAAWIVRELSELVQETTNVDFTNGSFLRQYAVVFAASTVLTLILWLLAIVKRAIRGVPLTTAIGEAIGFLWLCVMASAFTPLALYVVVGATDSVTDAIVSGTGSNSDAFFGDFAEALERGEDIGGGPIMLIVVSLVSILAAGVLFLELTIRAAMLYVGAMLGTAVYAGLVDKNLWKHVRGWAGIMIAVILIKPVIAIVLGLAGALTTAEEGETTATSAIVSGLAIILLAIFASAMIYRFVPGFGDEIVNQRAMRQDTASRAAGAAVSSTANTMKAGMTTHGSRGAPAGAAASTGGGGGAAGAGSTGSGIAGGVAAHGSRGGGGGAGRGAGGGATPRQGGGGQGGRGGGNA